MKITLICNCGLALETGGQTLLLDALTQELAPILPRAREDRGGDHTRGGARTHRFAACFFTHLHPDHFDREAAEEFSARHENTLVYIPSRQPAPETVSVGNFTVELHRVRHTQVAGYGKSTVDAMIDSRENASMLRLTRPRRLRIHEGVLRGQEDGPRHSGTGRCFFISLSVRCCMIAQKKAYFTIFNRPTGWTSQGS